MAGGVNNKYNYYIREMKGVERMFEPMTDKQYEGMLKDNIACLDRVAKCTNDMNALKQL